MNQGNRGGSVTTEDIHYASESDVAGNSSKYIFYREDARAAGVKSKHSTGSPDAIYPCQTKPVDGDQGVWYLTSRAHTAHTPLKQPKARTGNSYNTTLRCQGLLLTPPVMDSSVQLSSAPHWIPLVLAL